MKKLLLIVLVIFLVNGALFYMSKKYPKQITQPGKQVEKVKVPKPKDMIVDPAAWKEKFPLVYESFLKTSIMGDNTKEDDDLGGDHPIDYIKKYPNIAILYEGVGFAKEYYAARGHYYALEDVKNITRPKPGASCLACKTSEYEKLRLQKGEGFFAMDFNETVKSVNFGISCYNCHRNTPGEAIQPTTPQYNNAVVKLNRDIKPGTQACAQCHVEYYMDKKTQEVILPWDKGTEVDQIEAYYDEKGFSDWIHPKTGTPMLKVQHPEFEMFSGSVHDTMKVSCADCHMPTVTENGQQYKSHWVTSPLKQVDQTCGKCHADEIKGMVATVQARQTETEKMEVEVSDMLVKLTKDLSKAIEDKKLDEATLTKLRNLHRKAQYRWDFVFVENSTGFHNIEKARKTLNESKTYTQEALNILGGLK